MDKALEQEEAVRTQEPAIGQERQEEQQENDGLNLSRLLSLLGIDADPAGAIMEKARDQARDTGVDLVTAVVQALAESVLRTVLFTVFFAVITIVLKVAARVMDAALKLPGLHAANALGGAAVGQCFWQSGFSGAWGCPLTRRLWRRPAFCGFSQSIRP